MKLSDWENTVAVIHALESRLAAAERERDEAMALGLDVVKTAKEIDRIAHATVDRERARAERYRAALVALVDESDPATLRTMHTVLVAAGRTNEAMAVAVLLDEEVPHADQG